MENINAQALIALLADLMARLQEAQEDAATYKAYWLNKDEECSELRAELAQYASGPKEDDF